MTRRFNFLTGTAAVALLLAVGATSAKAADYAPEPGCTLSGMVMAGFMYDWQNSELDFGDGELNGLDVDWSTPFGEGAGLVTCGGFNIQADIAYYAHSADDDFDDDTDQTNSHIGGAVFYRDPASWAGGLQASWISQDNFGDDIDVFRAGLFGEVYLDDVFTLGASAAYYNKDWPFEKDESGFELAAWGRFYATPDFAFTVRGDVLLADFDVEGEDGDLDGFAITGDGEYLVWDQGLSLFAGARYAHRNSDFDAFLGIFEEDSTVEDFQVFAGIKFNFGQDGTLIERQRTGPVDNTSVFNEKLPEFFTSSDLAGDIID